MFTKANKQTMSLINRDYNFKEIYAKEINNEELCETINLTIGADLDSYLITIQEANQINGKVDLVNYFTDSKEIYEFVSKFFDGLDGLNKFTEFIEYLLLSRKELVHNFYRSLDEILNGGNYRYIDVEISLNDVAEVLASQSKLYIVNLDTIKRNDYYIIDYDNNRVASVGLGELISQVSCDYVIKNLAGFYSIITMLYEVFEKEANETEF